LWQRKGETSFSAIPDLNAYTTVNPLNTHSFSYFFKKIWWWNLLIDGILIIAASVFAYHFLTDKSWDTAVRVNQFQWIMALEVMHSVYLFIYSITRFWQRKFASGVVLFLHAGVLLIITGLLLSVVLMAGMK
jgi:hypothetical protein